LKQECNRDKIQKKIHILIFILSTREMPNEFFSFFASRKKAVPIPGVQNRGDK